MSQKTIRKGKRRIFFCIKRKRGRLSVEKTVQQVWTHEWKKRKKKLTCHEQEHIQSILASCWPFGDSIHDWIEGHKYVFELMEKNLLARWNENQREKETETEIHNKESSEDERKKWWRWFTWWWLSLGCRYNEKSWKNHGNHMFGPHHHFILVTVLFHMNGDEKWWGWRWRLKWMRLEWGWSRFRTSKFSRWKNLPSKNRVIGVKNRGWERMRKELRRWEK